MAYYLEKNVESYIVVEGNKHVDLVKDSEITVSGLAQAVAWEMYMEYIEAVGKRGLTLCEKSDIYLLCSVKDSDKPDFIQIAFWAVDNQDELLLLANRVCGESEESEDTTGRLVQIVERLASKNNLGWEMFLTQEWKKTSNKFSYFNPNTKSHIVIVNFTNDVFETYHIGEFSNYKDITVVNVYSEEKQSFFDIYSGKRHVPGEFIYGLSFPMVIGEELFLEVKED